MKIGAIADPPYKFKKTQVAYRTRKLEEAGLDSLWTGTMLLAESFTLAGYIAALATKATIAVGVVNPYTRHPMIVAREAVTLDRFYEHGTKLVLGFGWPLWIRDQFRIDAEPIEDMTIFVRTLRELFKGRTVSCEARGFKLVDGRVSGPKPGRIPIYVAANRRRALELTRRMADGVFLGAYYTPQHVQSVTNYLRTFETGTPNFDICAQIKIVITDKPRKTREELKPDLAYFLAEPGIDYYSQRSGIDAGFLREIRRILSPEYPLHPVGAEKLSRAARLIPDEYVDACCAIGTVKDCIEKLEEYKRAGLTCAVLSFQDSFNPVIPHLTRIVKSLRT